MLQYKASPALKSKILLKLSLAVFVSILCIEAIILVPSVNNYERDLKNRFRDVGRATAAMLLDVPWEHDISMLANLGRSALSAPYIRGLTVINNQKLVQAEFGAAPVGAGGSWAGRNDEERYSDDGAYLDIAFPNASDKGLVVVRFDAVWLRNEVNAFIWRIVGLVLLIASTVTVASMFIIVRFIIRPVLEMQANLRKASKDPEHGARYATSYRANDELGELVALLNQTLADMSTDRRSEIEMRDRRFLDFAEIASDWFWEMDEDLRFSYFSDRFTGVTGVAQERLLGITREENGNPGAPPEVWERQLSDLAAHRPFRGFEHPRTKADGSVVWLSISGRPVFDENGDFLGYRGVGADITHRVEVERELRVAKEEAEAGSRAKSEFLSSMSHELRTPLNAIMGFAQLLLLDKKKARDAQQDDSVGQILESSRHLLTLIEGLLELSKIDSGALRLSMDDLDPSSAIRDCLSMVRVMGNVRGITIDFENDGEDLPLVLADSIAFKQILLNILSNAVKYNNDKGNVSLRCEAIPGKIVRVSVSDNGPGIPTSRHGELFIPFNRLGMETKATEGTGIGLTICKKKVELMGGAIGFESVEGQGSTFWFELPRSGKPAAIGSNQNTAAAESGAKALAGAGDMPRYNIMYIEDNRANLLLMRRIIALVPEMTLISADTAEAGIEILKSKSPDMILVDINLPGMDGFQALKEIRSQPEMRSVPILAISANAMPKDVQRGLDAGFDAYLTKPLNVKSTLQAIKSALSIEA